MTDWINGGGFYLVQATVHPTPAELKVEMDALEMKLEAAEHYWAAKKEKTA